jgi:heme exporter protein C
MKRNEILNTAYKILGLALVIYGVTYGMLITLPAQPLLQQSSRNIFYHVPLWFTVIVMMGISVYQSIRVLRLTDPSSGLTESPLLADARAEEAARTGSLFIILGLLTGIIWSRVTWGENLPATDLSAWWVWDPIQVCALIALLIYMAYFLLRNSFSEPAQRAKVAAVYNIFAFATLIPLFFILPKIMSGLHPTSADSDAGGGSFIFSGGIDNRFRMILYPLMIGYILIAVWVYELRSRFRKLRIELENWLADQEYEEQVSGGSGNA